MSTAFSDACIHSLPHVCCCPEKSFCSDGNGSPDEILWFVWNRRIGKCIPKLILASFVRSRYQVVFDNEHSLHLWKRHPCTSTVERQLPDWREQVITWRDLRGLLFINPIELYWIATSNKYFNMGCVTFRSPSILSGYSQVIKLFRSSILSYSMRINKKSFAISNLKCRYYFNESAHFQMETVWQPRKELNKCRGCCCCWWLLWRWFASEDG
jgi:hypothetical protein